MSVGASLEHEVGGGYRLSALSRFGFADHRPSGEVGITRTNLSQTVGVTGYDRLATASD
jgi:hypothetical protein